MRKLLMRFKLDEVIGVFCMLLMLGVTFANVLSRYLLPFAWAFTEELVCGIFIIVSLVGASISIRNKSAMGISILTDKLPEKFRKYVVIVQAIAVVVFSFLLVKYGVNMMISEMKSGMRTAALGWPEAVFGSLVPIGGVFLAVSGVQYLFSAFPSEEKAEKERGKA